MRQIGSQEQELALFRDAVSERIQRGQPVKIYPGCGDTPAVGFLNLDIRNLLSKDDPRWETHQVFFFPFADVAWPIPDRSVDFIFHEDMLEHLTQREQVCFLAETLRVLKVGSWHRINTPSLAESMRSHSIFSLGMKGVFVGEWDEHGHKSVLTRIALWELATMVGYADIVFNQRNQSVSPHKFVDCRPGPDRDEVFGNIFADLLKR